MRTSSGICPGSEWVAQPKQGSYERKAISTRFSMPSATSPPLMNALAAFLIETEIGA